MKFESRFNVGDEVFVIQDNIIQKATVTKIKFPEPSLVFDSYDNNQILYYVWPQSFGKLPKSKSDACAGSIGRYENKVGYDMNDLCERMKENAKDSGLTK